MSFPQYPGPEGASDEPGEAAADDREGSSYDAPPPYQESGQTPQGSGLPQYPLYTPSDAGSQPGTDAASPQGTFAMPGYPTQSDETQPLRRPTKVLVGCIMGLVGGVLGAVLGVFYALISENSSVLDSYSRSDRHDVAHAFHIIGPIVAVWSLAVLALSLLALRGSKRAAIGLVVLGVAFVLLSLVSVLLGNSGGGPGFVWVVVSIMLVYGTRDGRQWFDARSRRQP